MTSPSFEKPSVVQSVTVLGSTGSIGINTLDVLARHSNKFSVFALTAYESDDLLFEQCQKFNPRYAVLVDVQRAEKLAIKLRALGSETEVLAGEQSLVEVAQHSLVDTVMAAIVGAAGLLPTLAAVRAGKKVLLANKEALVMAGKLFMDAVAESGSVLLPIDSEHNAIFQCLPQNKPASIGVELDAGNKQQIRKLLLTGSGGPFRTWSAEAMDAATVEQACKHPNWSMGQKISVDSATLMNKGLEFIEAKWLFDMAPSDIQVVIHPQSIVHSMVEYVDGSVLAQLGQPDMRTPIAHALAWPERIESGVDSLDWFTLSQLDFEAPDYERFPALSLCMAAASQGSSAPTVLNAANEVAVSAFLKKSIGFSHINHILDKVMLSFDFWEPSSISDVLQLDLQARESAKAIIARLN